MSAFTLDDNQTLLAESARKYAERGYSEAVRRASLDHAHACAPERWREFADFGWFALPLPEACGGLGGSLADMCVLAEELGRALVVEPWLPCAVMAGGLLADTATGAIADEWLAALASGGKRVAFAAWEPGSRFDAGRIDTRAEAVEGGFRLNGAKELVLGAPGADALLIAARCAGEVSLFIVDAATSGLEMSPHRLIDGTCAAQVRFEQAWVSAQSRLGGQADVSAAIALAMDRATLVHCAQTVGAMARAFEITLDYLKTRKQFGRVLAGNQVLQHRLVDLFVGVEEARALVRAAAHGFGGDAGSRSYQVAAARAYVAQSARTTWEEAVQMHGAIGMTDEYIIGQYARYLAGAQALFGDADLHLERMMRAEKTPDGR